MEREASTWGLETGDVHSPDETGSPNGSLKGEGRTAPFRSVPGNRAVACGRKIRPEAQTLGSGVEGGDLVSRVFGGEVVNFSTLI